MEQRRVRPVQVLDHEDEGAAGGHRLDNAPPGGKELGLIGAWALSIAQPEQGSQPCSEPLAVRGPADQRLQRAVQLCCHLGRRVGLEDARLGLDDLTKSPERDAVPIGQAAALTPRHEFLAVVNMARELMDQPALAQSRLPEQGDKLH